MLVNTTIPLAVDDAYHALVNTPANQLGQVDIARMNLACAFGLPGAGEVDIASKIATLNQWAQRIRLETERHLYRFHNSPTEFQNSEAYFRMLMMAQVLCEDFGVHYNPASLHFSWNLDRAEPLVAADWFLPGVLGPARSGTCASMSVLYVALGRRLGYPMYLVLAPGHVLARWASADGKERFNIEATEDRGFGSPPDDYYIATARAHGVPFHERDLASGLFMVNLSPSEEAAFFFNCRGACWYSHKQWHDSLAAYSKAACLNPKDAYSAAAGKAVTRILLSTARATNHGEGVRHGEDDPRAWLSPTDAAHCLNVAGHVAEIDGHLAKAQGRYAEASRLDPSSLDFQLDCKRIKYKTLAQALAQHHPPFPPEQFLEWGRHAEVTLGDLYAAQACFARAVALNRDPLAVVCLHRMAQRELRIPAGPDHADLRLVLPKASQALIYATRGTCLEAQGRFAEARDHFAVAAHLAPACTQYHHAVIRSDQADQKLQYSASRDGQAPPPAWQPRIIAELTICVTPFREHSVTVKRK